MHGCSFSFYKIEAVICIEVCKFKQKHGSGAILVWFKIVLWAFINSMILRESYLTYFYLNFLVRLIIIPIL